MEFNTIQSTSIEQSSSRKKKRYLKLTASEKQFHVESYLKSNQSQRAYCAAHGLTVSSFKNWQSRYGHDNSKKFTPVVNSPSLTPSPRATRIEIVKTGCKVVLCEITDIKTTLDLMKEVLSCN